MQMCEDHDFVLCEPCAGVHVHVYMFLGVCIHVLCTVCMWCVHTYTVSVCVYVNKYVNILWVIL